MNYRNYILKNGGITLPTDSDGNVFAYVQLPGMSGWNTVKITSVDYDFLEYGLIIKPFPALPSNINKPGEATRLIISCFMKIRNKSTGKVYESSESTSVSFNEGGIWPILKEI